MFFTVINMATATKIQIDYLIENPHRFGNYIGYERLQPIHSEWIKFCLTDPGDHCLMAHRGSYKTSAITVVGVIWYLFFSPNTRFLIACADASRAKDLMGEIKRNYEKPALRELYGLIGIDEPIDKTWWKADSISLSTRTIHTKEGNITARGAGNTITGLHCDIIIGDDIVTLKDRTSQAERDFKRIWIQEFQSVVDPGPDNKISFVGTHWHKDDIYATLDYQTREYPIGSLEILTDQDVAKIRKQQTKAFFAAQYELKHISDEDVVFQGPLEYDKKIKGKCIGYIDPAAGGRDSTAMIFGILSDGNLYIIGAYLINVSLDKLYTKILKTSDNHLCSELIIEDNGFQKALLYELRVNRGMDNIVSKTSSVNKNVRIMNVLKYWDKIYWSKDIKPEFLSEVLDYFEPDDYMKNNVQADDAADAMAGLVERVFKGSGWAVREW